MKKTKTMRVTEAEQKLINELRRYLVRAELIDDIEAGMIREMEKIEKVKKMTLSAGWQMSLEGEMERKSVLMQLLRDIDAGL